jgi:hypothetical protein
MGTALVLALLTGFPLFASEAIRIGNGRPASPMGSERLAAHLSGSRWPAVATATYGGYLSQVHTHFRHYRNHILEWRGRSCGLTGLTRNFGNLLDPLTFVRVGSHRRERVLGGLEDLGGLHRGVPSADKREYHAKRYAVSGTIPGTLRYCGFMVIRPVRGHHSTGPRGPPSNGAE